MRHQDLTINHIVESWTFANTAARIAAGSYVAGDVGRIGFQSDNRSYWRLLTTTPTWSLINGTFAATQTSVLSASPVSTIVSPGIMVGLAAIITPGVNGKILATLTGSFINGVPSKQDFVQMRYASGAAPVGGAAATGAPIGAGQIAQVSTAGECCPFSVTALVTGLTPGTSYWFDLAIGTTSGGSMQLVNIDGTLIELP